jgi:hypothetical protein
MMAKKKRGSFLLAALPLIIGILITPLALQAASVMAMSGPDALTALFPWSEMLKVPMLQIPLDVSMPSSQLLMYLQFPAYGLVMVWLRERSLLVAFGVVALVHMAGVIAAILLAHVVNPALRFY